jgi:hypothetical protein
MGLESGAWTSFEVAGDLEQLIEQSGSSPQPAIVAELTYASRLVGGLSASLGRAAFALWVTGVFLTLVVVVRSELPRAIRLLLALYIVYCFIHPALSIR